MSVTVQCEAVAASGQRCKSRMVLAGPLAAGEREQRCRVHVRERYTLPGAYDVLLLFAERDLARLERQHRIERQAAARWAEQTMATLGEREFWRLVGGE